MYNLFYYTIIKPHNDVFLIWGRIASTVAKGEFYLCILRRSDLTSNTWQAPIFSVSFLFFWIKKIQQDLSKVWCVFTVRRNTYTQKQSGL